MGDNLIQLKLTIIILLFSMQLFSQWEEKSIVIPLPQSTVLMDYTHSENPYFYLSFREDNQALIKKLDIEGNQIWTKDISTVTSNTLSKITYNNLNNEVLVSNGIDLYKIDETGQIIQIYDLSQTIGVIEEISFEEDPSVQQWDFIWFDDKLFFYVISANDSQGVVNYNFELLEYDFNNQTFISINLQTDSFPSDIYSISNLELVPLSNGFYVQQTILGLEEEYIYSTIYENHVLQQFYKETRSLFVCIEAQLEYYYGYYTNNNILIRYGINFATAFTPNGIFDDNRKESDNHNQFIEVNEELLIVGNILFNNKSNQNIDVLEGTYSSQIPLLDLVYGFYESDSLFFNKLQNIDNCALEMVELNNQAQIVNFEDDYGNCPHIYGNLTISGNDIVDLNPLIFITEINGDLIIRNTSIDQLSLNEMLVVKGQIVIEGNLVLSDCSLKFICEKLSLNPSSLKILNNLDKCLNKQQASENCNMIDLDMDGFPLSDDCDDQNININPGEEELAGNGIDDNCDGINGIDVDQDGFGENDDCNDLDPSINPMAVEIPNNLIDENCDGYDFPDQDEDGFIAPLDCDDNNFMVNPGVFEVNNNGIDDDCNQATLDVTNFKVCRFQDLRFFSLSELNDFLSYYSDCLYIIEGDLEISILNENGEGESIEDFARKVYVVLGNTSLVFSRDNNFSELQFLGGNLSTDIEEIHCPKLSAVNGNVNLNYLQNDVAFPQLKSVKGSIRFNYCESSTIELSNLLYSSDLILSDNANLNVLSLSESYSIKNKLEIINCTNLSMCNLLPICLHIAKDKFSIIQNNDSGCNTAEEIVSNCLDLDMDGFIAGIDCDDNNNIINPGEEEVPYDGIDNDCNELTLDDDLDQDGYNLAEDCDDMNADINPVAMETPNNGIDEDCDGSDLITAIEKIIKPKIILYPNPTINMLYVDNPEEKTIEVIFYNTMGELWYRRRIGIGVSKFEISRAHKGVYIVHLVGNDFIDYRTIIIN